MYLQDQVKTKYNRTLANQQLATEIQDLAAFNQHVSFFESRRSKCQTLLY